MNNWRDCKNILVIRLDNMGDLLMTSPAIRGIKESLACKITVLTSKMAVSVSKLIPCIDEVIEFNAPWMKLDGVQDAESYNVLVKELLKREFDGCLIFNVYSQNPVPAIMIAYLAGIPLRAAYSRENLYDLLTDWIPDPEPYQCIKHQVERDLDLILFLGFHTSQKTLVIEIGDTAKSSYKKILKENCKLQPGEPFILVHAEVSEPKRRYPAELWIEIGKLIVAQLPYKILITGTKNGKSFAESLEKEIGSPQCLSVAGLFLLEELTALIQDSIGMISVNTGTIHLGAAVDASMVVLYAQSNPQHTPWMAHCNLLEYSIPQELQSKNPVIQWVNSKMYQSHFPHPRPTDVVCSLIDLLKSKK
jgi:ADP-heptose:LPS heptosyltransferase